MVYPTEKAVRNAPSLLVLPVPVRHRERGATLITALAIMSVSMILITGITLFALSHNVRQRREADYAMALQIAEAGLNWELNHIGKNLTSPSNIHTLGNTANKGANGSVAGGTFNVHVTNTDGSPGWTMPNDMMIVSTGTVGSPNPITRTVTAICKTTGGSGGQSIFAPQYAVFAYKRLLFRNSSNAVNGNMGANGPAPGGTTYSVDTEANGVGNANNSGKPLTLAGGATLKPGNSINPNFTNNPNSINQIAQNVNWPLVDTIAAGQFANGWNSLSATAAVQAQWAKVRMYRTQSRVMSPTGTKPINTVTNTSTILDNNCVRTYAEDNQPTNCIIFPPGDYYFTRVQLTSSGFSGPAPILYIDCNALSTGGSPGPVRFWINGTDASDDFFKSEIRYTSSVNSEKAQLSRIFYNKPRTLSSNGNGIYSGVYAIRVGPGTGTAATVSLDQSTKFNGTIISDLVTFQGGADINYITGIAHATDYSTGGGVGPYSFASDWKEQRWREPSNPTITRGVTVFSDGTSR